MGVGFIGSKYFSLYPSDTTPEHRDTVIPNEDDVLFTRSTVDNYAVLRGTPKRDIETNLMHLMDVLPNVRGTFTWTGTWFSFGKNRGGHDAGFDAWEPARETDPCNPTGFYSITKLAAEQIIASYTKTAQAGLVPGPRNYRILRLCSVIGNDPRAGKEKGAIEMMLRKIVRGEEVNLYTGDAYRNVLHVDDVCRAIRLCMEHGDLDTIYNIGAPTSVRVFDLLQHALAVTGSKSRINLVAQPRFHEIVQTESFWMDTTKLASLGFTPSMDAYQAVDRVIAGMRA